MPVPCRFCETKTHDVNDGPCMRVFISPSEALSLIANTYHVFMSNGLMIVGMDWDKESITELLESHDIEICDPNGMSRKMKHGIVALDKENEFNNKFIETNEEKLSAFEKLHRV